MLRFYIKCAIKGRLQWKITCAFCYVVRYVYLIFNHAMNKTIYFYNQIMVYYGDIKLQSYKTSLLQNGSGKVLLYACIGRRN